MSPKALTPGDRARIERAMPDVWRLAVSIAYAIRRVVAEDDLNGAGLLKLTAITPDFNPAIQPDFISFWYLPVRGAMWGEARKATKNARLRAIYEADQRAGVVMQDDRDNPENFMSAEEIDPKTKIRRYLHRRAVALALATLFPESTSSEDAEERVGRAQALACLREAITKLDDRSRRIIEVLHREEGSVESAAEELKLSPRQVRRLHNEAREALARALLRVGFTKDPDRKP